MKHYTHTLYVDMDGTITLDNVFYKTLRMNLLKINYFKLLKEFILRGFAGIKKYLSEVVEFDCQNIKYNTKLIKFLQNERKRRKIVLITGTGKKTAEKIGNFVGVFDEIIGTEDINLIGANKLKKILDLEEKREFGYIGDAKIDLKIFDFAAEKILVGDKILKKMKERYSHFFHFDPKYGVCEWQKIN